jgi:uncharacterized protein
MPSFHAKFWEQKALQDMNLEEWEAICDGCGRCCLVKLEDEDSGDVYFTDVACRLLDLESCQCQDYPHRLSRVPDCVKLTRDNINDIQWLPETCSYRVLRDSGTLPSWHPLVTGEATSVHQAGISVRNRVVSESSVSLVELEAHIIRWVE